MNRRTRWWFALLLLICAGRGDAAIFERDWKTPGDGLLTYDDVNQRVWLDVPVSQLSQFPEPQWENAIAEISPGGLFDGFTWAKRDDVLAFAQSAGIDTSTSNLFINQGPLTEAINLLGPTFQSTEPGGSFWAIGLINEIQNRDPFPPPYDGAAFLVHLNPSTGNGFAGLFSFLGNDLRNPISNGLMLYQVVPEPSPASLMVVGVWLYFLSRIGLPIGREKGTF